MTADTLAIAKSPYLDGSPPQSTGRILLAVGFSHYCALHFGLSPQEIAEAFARGDDVGARERVVFSARLLGGTLANGTVKVWARPFGGGEPEQLRSSAWEIDDFTTRFATSAIDPEHPFDQSASTHWLFVDEDDWNAVMVASVEDFDEQRRKIDHASVSPEDPPARRATSAAHDRLLRLPEVRHRTGMSRSTIYRRIEQGRFPSSLPLTGNISVWREQDVTAWIADPD